MCSVPFHGDSYLMHAGLGESGLDTIFYLSSIVKTAGKDLFFGCIYLFLFGSAGDGT